LKSYLIISLIALFALGFGSGFLYSESGFDAHCEPDARQAYLQKSFDDLANEKTELALTDLEPIFHCEDTTSEEEIHKSSLFFALGHYTIAEKYVLRAIRLDPYDAEAFGLRGQIYFQQGQFEKSLRSLNRSLELAPGSDEIERARFAAKSHLGPSPLDPETRGPASLKQSD
jgi:tetratricopeptide (TPR) repeat protein